MSMRINLTGRVFGKLTALHMVGRRNGQPLWRCKCVCGNTCIVEGRNLRSGSTRSCGCIRRENTKYELSELECRKGSESLERLKLKEDPYQNLANAIVAVAADDYRTALKEDKPKLKKSLEQFFHSDMYRILTKVDPDTLLELLHKEHREGLSIVHV